MSSRLANLMMYVLLIAIAAGVIWQVHGLPNPFGGSIGSGGFPTLMAIAAIGLCTIGAIRTALGPEGPRIDIPGLGKVVATILAMVALFGLWQLVGYFFPLAFVFLTGLLCLYAADGTLTPRLVLLNSIGSAVVILCIYLFFTHVLYVRF
ncbi:MAG: tripartite tricarboxylate transporter TctB family protein [Rhodobacter sp.]|nr:tripartite tricarboxylate transporter TctB family protein [Paracoccaceae bacterium]MCC0076357.1 tripartite tricarboxylate transporter TctB family protein [Rhodobacter sp.]